MESNVETNGEESVEYENNVYECMYLLDTNKVAGDVQGAARQLHELVEKHNAEILASRPWNELKLAYPIRTVAGKHKKGLYYLMYFHCGGEVITPLEQDLKLNEMVIRSLILKIDPQLVDLMLSVARDEHAVALQSVQEENEALTM